jgi:hypothetical protein
MATMRNSTEILRRTLALGIVSALAFAGLDCYAREPARANLKPAAVKVRIQDPAAARMGSWSKVDGLDVTWDVAAHAVHRPVHVTLKRGMARYTKPAAARTRNSVAMETLEIAHEGFTTSTTAVPMETVTIVSERIQRVSP